MPDQGEMKPAPRLAATNCGWVERPAWLVEQHLALVDEISQRKVNRKKTEKTSNERSSTG